MYKLFDISDEPRINGTQELYFRKNGDKVSFDTYFNSIPVRKLRKYTEISRIIFSQEAEICTEKGMIKKGSSITVADIPDDAEMLYIRTDQCGGRIAVFAEGKHRDIRPVIIICTYHREQQVKANIDHLLRQESDIRIILVDNASSIPVDSWKNSRITVLHNINSGGSGGFACGMRYAAEQKRFTHMILMDDDVVIDFTAVSKMTGFLSFMKDEYADISVSGSMIYADRPTIQFECGGFFSKDGTQTGHGYNFDLTDRQQLILNEADNHINYGGWWFMCMPLKYAEKGEFPAPFFLKYDDVEYALRCRLDIITLNGVGIWHENFGNKYNSVQEYFNTRNYLFLMKKHSPGFTPKKAYKAARYLLLEKLCRQQYKMAEAVLLGYEDFLKGEKYLDEIDYCVKLSQLRKLNYRYLSEEESAERYGVAFDEKLYTKCGSRPFRRYMQPLLYGHLVPGFLCRKLTITDVISDRKEHYFRAKNTLHFNTVHRQGYVTQRSLSSFLRCIFRIRKIYKGCC